MAVRIALLIFLVAAPRLAGWQPDHTALQMDHRPLISDIWQLGLFLGWWTKGVLWLTIVIGVSLLGFPVLWNRRARRDAGLAADSISCLGNLWRN